jgi:tetratricopeptide (TPR) repeat protein
MDRAQALNPNLAMAFHLSGWIRCFIGQPDLAIEHLERAVRLSPLDPQRPGMLAAIAAAHFAAGRCDVAASLATKAMLEQSNNFIAALVAAASNALAGNLEAAKTATRVSTLKRPAFSDQKRQVPPAAQTARGAGPMGRCSAEGGYAGITSSERSTEPIHWPVKRFCNAAATFQQQMRRELDQALLLFSHPPSEQDYSRAEGRRDHRRHQPTAEREKRGDVIANQRTGNSHQSTCDDAAVRARELTSKP